MADADDEREGRVTFSLSDMFRMVFKDFAKEYPHLVIGFLVIVVVTSIINTVFLPRSQGRFIDGLKNATPSTVPWMLAGVYLVYYVFERSLQLGMMYVNNHMMPRFTHFVRLKFFRNTIQEFERNSMALDEAELVTNLNSIPWALYNLFYYLVSVLALQMLIAIGGTAYLGYMDWRIGLLALSIMGAMGLLFYRGLHRCLPLSYENYAVEKDVQRLVLDKADNLEVILQSNSEEAEMTEYGTMEQKRVQSYLDNFFCFFRSKLIMTYITVLLVVGILVLLLYKWKRDFHTPTPTTIGEVVALISVITLLGRAYDRIRESLGGINSALGILYHEGERLTKIDNVVPELVPLLSENGQPALVVEDLTFTHEGASRPLLQQFGLQIPARRATCLVGPSGTGKSTLFRIVTGSHPTYSGTVRLFGTDIRQLDLHQLRAHFQLVPQNPKLFSRTVAYNVLYGNSHATLAQAEQLVTDLQLTGMFSTLSHGLQTQVGAEGKLVSGGQRQAIMLLRALLSLAPVILMDEPTSNLDAHAKGLLMGAVQRAGTSRTILIITHDTTLGEYCSSTPFFST
jgi:ABC-type multidrug transport system fused ATPase/permease subunit